MTPPCARCHGVSDTSPLPEGWERSASTASSCSAESRWGQAISPPDSRALESWIRSNYERAREEPRPFRIDLSEAHIRADIRVQPRIQTIWASIAPITINTSGAHVTADWEFYDNAMVLGMRELLNIESLGVNAPLGAARAWPQSLSVGNFGQLHFITQTTPGALFLLEPFMVPRPPIGEDLPTSRQWQACEARNAGDGIDAGLENCAVPMVYPDHRDDPRLDLILTPILSRYCPEFLDSNGRLPTNYNLETLLDNFRAYRRNHPPPPAPRPDPITGELPASPSLLERIHEWISPGSHIEIDIARLNDFFLPGLLDLGPSRGQVRLTYHGGQHFSGSLEDFEFQLDPSGYPASINGEPSPVQIETAVLSAGSAPTTLDSLEVLPGLRLDYDASRGEVWLEGNVHLQSDLTVPLLGALEVSGDLAIRTSLRRQDGAWHPVPGTTHVRWSNGEIYAAEGGRPLLTALDIDVSDVTDSLDPFAPDNSAGFRVRSQGRWGSAASFDAELSLPVPRDPVGHYDFQSLIQELPAELALNFYGAQSYQANVSVLAPPAEEGHRQILAGLDLNRGIGEARRPMVRDAVLRVDLRRNSESEDGIGVDLAATRIAGFGVDLLQPNVRVEVDRFRHPDGITEYRIPTFSIRGNPRNSGAGLLRGPFQIELQPLRSGEPLTAVWNASDRLLNFRNLDLRFSLQGIRLAPLQSTRFRRLVDHRVAAIGLDGHVQGSLNAELPLDRRNWRANGAISLRGDRDGDIYFLDSSGRRVGAPLIRDTRWRFDRVDRINWQRRYALGRFHLDTLINFSSFLPPSTVVEEEPIYGLRGQRLLPYEINGVMPYNNQPWDLRGFRNRIVDYLTTLCRRDAACREELR